MTGAIGIALQQLVRALVLQKHCAAAACGYTFAFNCNASKVKLSSSYKQEENGRTDKAEVV